MRIKWLKTSIVDRYLRREIFQSFLTALVFLSFIFLMFQILKLAEYLIEHGVAVAQFVEMIGYILMGFLPLGLPVAFLIGVLSAFARMSSDSEIVALKSTGYGLRRLSIPVFALSALVVLGSLFVNLSLVPWAETSKRRLLLKLGNSRFTQMIREGTFSTGLENVLVYAEKSNPENGRMERVFLYDERDPARPLAIVAKNGEIIRVVNATGDSEGMLLQLQQGTVLDSEVKSASTRRILFEVYQMWLDLSGSIAELTVKPTMFTFQELLEARKKTRKFDVELWRRIATAISPIFFVLIAMGFGITRTRAHRSSVMLISLLILAVFWQLQVASIQWANTSTLSPGLWLSIPNFVVLFAGFWSFRRASW
jgi:lipopolysaccharide export system permease protein